MSYIPYISSNTPRTLVLRDASGDFSAELGTFQGLIFPGSSGAITLQAINSVITPYTIRLPAAQGAVNTTLVNDGSGNLSWNTVSGLGYILQNGNTFSAEVRIGAADNFGLSLLSNNLARLSITNAGVVSIANLSTGVAHADVSGNLTSSLIVNADITNGTINLTTKVTGVLPFANGGTNASLTASNGGIFYSTASAGAILAGSPTANQVLLSGSNTTPAWSSMTYLTAVAQGDLLYASASNTLSALPKNATATRYLSNTGTTNNPAWAQIALATGVSGQLPLANGGTSANLTASNGGIFYSTASAGAILAGTATANQIVLSGASTTPAWSTATYLATVAQGDLLYASATNIISALTKDTNATRYLSNTGTTNNPAWAQIALATGVSGQLPLANGGTNANLTASNGGIFYSTAGAGAILAGTATAGKVLQSGASTTPGWSTPTYPSASGSAGQVLRSNATNNIYSTFTIPDTYAQGDLLYCSATNVLTALTKNASATRYLSNTGTTNNPAWAQIDLTTGVTGVLPVANGGSGTSTAFTLGSIVFAGASGVYTQDNTNFFWDDTNNRLGIGTTSPVTTLHAGGDGSFTKNATNAVTTTLALSAGNASSVANTNISSFTKEMFSSAGVSLKLSADLQYNSTEGIYEDFIYRSQGAIQRIRTIPYISSAGDTQLVPKFVLAGQEFGTAATTSTDGVAILLARNVTNNRWISFADTSLLTQNSTNPTVQIRINGAGTRSTINALATDGSTTLDLGINTGGGNVTIGNSASTAIFPGTILAAGATVIANYCIIGPNSATNKFRAQAYDTYSSEHLKNTIQDVDTEEALNRVLAMRNVSYLWNEGLGDNVPGLTPAIQYGYLAQDVAIYRPDAVTLDEHGEAISVDYAKISSDHCGAIKALYAMILQLKNKILILEGNDTCH